MKHVILRSSLDGDWEALYINGVNVEENHSLSASQVLKELSGDEGFTFEEQEEPETDEADGSWFFPAKLF